ncbi:MAG: chitobiase/beta-hexosaminidase C-terminal domain-containing protein [Phycisphaerae bacterium]|nr:chitobiase/beta-hexosaminidase C-terminal domain-containing protein [Phycisphaerae bacterium]
MMRRNWIACVPAVLLCLAAGAVPAAADETPELELKPCTIELVDGTEVAGKLAVQFDMDDHLIVYSPRLATVRSFLKDHVHALTVDGTREELNPKRELTDEDKKLLGQVDWPDAPPAEGYKPAYTTQTWDKPAHLVVWAAPGDSGRAEEAKHWLVNGAPVTQLPVDHVGKFKPSAGEVDWQPDAKVKSAEVLFGRNADLLVPVARREYQARIQPIFSARHITVENHARFEGRNTPGVFGNVWIAGQGSHRVSHGYFPTGAKHTFFFNDKPGLELGQRDDDGVRRRVARYIQVLKHPDATVEFLGASSTTDEFHIRRGTMILAEDAQMLIGNRCTQSIAEGSALVVHSGSFFGKHSGMGGNDMVVSGTLLAGSPERPLKRDCTIGLDHNDWWGDIRAMKAEGGIRWGGPGSPGQIPQHSVPWLSWRDRDDWPVYISLTVPKSGVIRVHSADPAKARLVLRWHRRDGFGGAGAVTGERPATPAQKKLFKEQYHGRINAVFVGDVQFDGVVFDNFHKGGILLADRAMRDKWRHVYFGPNNAARPEALFAVIPEALHIGDGAGGRWDYGEDEVIPIIDVPPGIYGDAQPLRVKVSLPEGSDPRTQIRYTLDGTIVDADSPLYDGPVTISETKSLKARAFTADGQRLGREARARYRFRELEPVASQTPEDTQPGLRYAYHHNWRGDLDEREPEATGVVETPDLSMRESYGHAVVFTGYVSVDEADTWTFYVTSDNNSELYIDDRLVVDNTIRGPRQRVIKTHAGQIDLEAGPHAIRIVTRDCREVLDVSWQRGDGEIEPIPAEALSH